MSLDTSQIRREAQAHALERLASPAGQTQWAERKSALAEFVTNRPSDNLPDAQYLAVTQHAVRGRREVALGEKTIEFRCGQYATNSAEEAKYLAAQPGITVEDIRVKQGRRSKYFSVGQMPWKKEPHGSLPLVDDHPAGI